MKSEKHSKQQSSTIRRIIFLLLLFTAFIFAISRLSEVQQVAETMQKGDWRWLGLGILAHLLWLITMAACFQELYAILGLKEKLVRLLLLYTAANFVNIVAPSAGIGGMAIFLDDASKNDHNPGRVTTAAALYILLDYFAILSFVALGLIALFRRNQLNGGEIAAAILLLLLAITFATLLYLGMRSEEKMARLLSWSSRKINGLLRPLLKRDYINPARAAEFARDLAEGLKQVRHHPTSLIKPALLALLGKALLNSVLAFIFLAFGQTITLGTLVGGFSISYLFVIISPTPAGLGFVEGAMSLALTSLRVPFTQSIILTLSYRGITFWLTLVYGIIALRFVNRLTPTPAEEIQ
ncbi:MAG: flippase-like domain-containing protein [Anaerolineales bacterium]|nr:flippase-like domain-containing protein [Anaerolineales bacterium]